MFSVFMFNPPNRIVASVRLTLMAVLWWADVLLEGFAVKWWC